jgi:hypothetical protein
VIVHPRGRVAKAAVSPRKVEDLRVVVRVEIVRKAAAVRRVDAKADGASVATEAIAVTTGAAAIVAASKARLKSISKN